MNAAIADPTVNRRTLSVSLIIAAGCLLGVMLMTDLLSGSGNSLAKLARALAVAGALMGFLNPRVGLYLLVFSTAYLDLLKRMLVFYDRPTMIDLFYVLGVAPLILGGVTMGVIVGGLLGKFELRSIHWKLLGFALLYNLAVAWAAFSESGPMSAAATVANQSFYSLLIFVVPALFQRVEEFWKLARFALWVFVPVAGYAIYQSVFGLSMFEIAYLKSGLTIMVKELDDVRPRPFSTLSSCGALGFVSATMFVLSLAPLVAGRAHPEVGKHRNLFLLLALLFLAATAVSLVRSANIVWLVALPALFLLANRRRTKIFYASCVGVFMTLVLASNWLLKMLPVWDSYLIKSTPFLLQATRIQTFGDRLHSYNQLKNPDNYSLFGLSHEVATHDSITAALVRHGAVPMIILAVIVIVALIKIHGRLQQLDNPAERRLAALYMGTVAAIFAGGALFGQVFGIFPINTYWWMIMGALMSMTLARSKAPVEQHSPEPAPVPVPVPVPERKRGIPFGNRPVQPQVGGA